MRTAEHPVSTAHLLIVEDERPLGRLLERGLAARGYTVDLAADGSRAQTLLARRSYDAAVLDVASPELDGFEVCARLRRSGSTVPVLLLSGQNTASDRIRGLDAGADDCLGKPFSFDELCARVRALTRRAAGDPAPGPGLPVLCAGSVVLDRVGHRVWCGTVETYLSAREFTVLELLMRHPGQVVSRARILSHVWGSGHPATSNVVDQYVRYLRNKLGPDVIETVRGAGYRMRTLPAS